MAASTPFWTAFFLVCFVVFTEADNDLEQPETTARGLETYEIAPPYYGATVKAERYILPVLKWSLSQLQPFLDRATHEAHYYGHHEAYRKKLNTALQQWRDEFPDDELARESIVRIIEDIHKVPEKYFTTIVNNGGGYVNHCFYWGCMMPNLEENATAREPTGTLREEIEQVFGSYQEFKDEFTKQALAKFGSGYVWLVRNPKMERRQLFIVQTDNQDCPLTVGEKPLLVIDVWEHAYYLKHKFRRADYVNDWWMLVDWENVAELNEFWKNDMKLGPKYFEVQTTKPETEDEKKEEL